MRNIPFTAAAAGVILLSATGVRADSADEYPAFSDDAAIAAVPASQNEIDREIDDSLLAIVWPLGQWRLSVNYYEMEWLPAPAPGLRETEATLRGKATYTVGPTFQLAVSGFRRHWTDETGSSVRSSGGLLQFKFKM